MTNDLLITNCRLYTDLSGVPANILVRDGIIADTRAPETTDNVPKLDANGAIAIPGLIDVHIQGAGGADVLDASEEAVRTMSRTLARLGTTGFLATTVVKPKENNRHLHILREMQGPVSGGASILGTHLEGPFIHPLRKGGIDPGSIYESSAEKLQEILDITGDSLRMMTIAPELPGNHTIIRLLREHGIIASFAHSTATYAQTIEGFKAGINHVTHLCNAMEPVHHREPGPLPALFEQESITAQIISDGHHIHPGMVRLILQAIGAERCICITDGVQAMGLPEGVFTYNGREYISSGGAARYHDGTLIGSTLPLLQVVKRFSEFTGCALDESIHTASLMPAKLLGIDERKGSLAQGKDADIVLVDDSFNVLCTVIDGCVVWKP